ncbi:MAG: hypothetical protein PVJ49_18710, partial [Acidobacteriota bacterium]
MCGIAGMIDPRLGREEGESLLSTMLDSIRHRGPDASATWIEMPVLLGHDRLSIIDLSDLGNQPMAYDDLVIVYNGEVYNYLEIRGELEDRGYLFRSRSDTEVILAAYKEWGADCVQHFVGMWAFAIWDRTRRELFCSRDGFRRQRSADLKTTVRVAATALLATMVGEQRLWMRHFRPTLAEALRNDIPYALDDVPGSRLNQYLYNLIFGSFLPAFLHYGDRMSMAWSV